MTKIDIRMLSSLEKWCCNDTQSETSVLYVSSRDRAVTMATIRKLIYETEKQDKEGEQYIALYSALNFSHSAREYFAEIADLYGIKTKKRDCIDKIIKSIPPTADWITLIISDIQELAGFSEKLKEVIDTTVKFSSKGASVILVSEVKPKDLYMSCPKLNAFFEDTKETDKKLPRIGCYIQEDAPELEEEIFEDEKDERCALQRYLEIIYEQRKRKQFDYESYKQIVSSVWAYLSVRITGEYVRREDLPLIETLADFEIGIDMDMDGCKCWEYEAAGRFAQGLNQILAEKRADNDLSADDAYYFRTDIREKEMSYGCISFGGCINTSVKVATATISEKMDLLAEAIKASAYDGDNTRAWKLSHLLKHDNMTNEDENEIEYIQDALSSLTDKIKEISLETVNKGMKTK